MSLVLYFFTLLKSLLFSSGGYGPLPSLHTDFLARGWATEQTFTESLAIGQITPGPNGLWVLCLCYLTAGIPGAVLGCVALVLPPLLILVVVRFYGRYADRPATQGFLDGVVLVISTFSVLVVFQIFVENGIEPLTVAIAIASAVLALSRKVSANLILLAAVVIGVIFC